MERKAKRVAMNLLGRLMKFGSWSDCARGLVAAIAATLVFVTVASAAHAASPRACAYGYCAPSSSAIKSDIVRQSTSITNDLVSSRLESAFTFFDQSQTPSTPLNYASSGPMAAPLGYASVGQNMNGAFDALAPKGVTAVSADKIWHFWVSADESWLGNSQTNANYRGTLFTGVGGLDVHVTPDVIVGVLAAYQRLDLTTLFNNGTLDSDGFTLGTYGAVRLSSVLSLDGQIEHTWLNYSETQTGASGNFNAGRWAGEVDLRANKQIDNWNLKSSLGYYYASENDPAYTLSTGATVASTNAYLGQIRLKGQVGYDFTVDWGKVTPFASARLELTTAQSAGQIIDGLGNTAQQGWVSSTFEVGVENQVGKDLTLSAKVREQLDYQTHSAFGVFGSLQYKF